MNAIADPIKEPADSHDPEGTTGSPGSPKGMLSGILTGQDEELTLGLEHARDKEEATREQS